MIKLLKNIVFINTSVFLVNRWNTRHAINKHFFYPTEDGKEISSNDVPENNPQYTTVYVGNLGSEVRNFVYIHFSIWIDDFPSLLFYDTTKVIF